MTAKVIKKPEVSGEDQRYFPRWEVSNRVIFQLEKAPEVIHAQTKDLSCAGTCLKVDRPIQKQKVKLTVFLSRETSVLLDGEVLWSKNSGGDVEIGVGFYNTTAQVQDLILQHAFEVNREKVVDNWFKGWEEKPA